MKTEQDIQAKINELEKQKIQIAELGRLGNTVFSDVVTSILLIEKQILLLKWILQ